jgi:hypothetical protein
MIAVVGTSIALVLIGLALVVVRITAKEPTPQQIAEIAERILSGSCGAWDVDDYAHLNPKTPLVRDLWRSTMSVGGLPEEWALLDGTKQSEIRQILRRLRDMRIQPSR